MGSKREIIRISPLGKAFYFFGNFDEWKLANLTFHATCKVCRLESISLQWLTLRLNSWPGDSSAPFCSFCLSSRSENRSYQDCKSVPCNLHTDAEQNERNDPQNAMRGRRRNDPGDLWRIRVAKIYEHTKNNHSKKDTNMGQKDDVQVSQQYFNAGSFSHMRRMATLDGSGRSLRCDRYRLVVGSF